MLHNELWFWRMRGEPFWKRDTKTEHELFSEKNIYGIHLYHPLRSIQFYRLVDYRDKVSSQQLGPPILLEYYLRSSSVLSIQNDGEYSDHIQIQIRLTTAIAFEAGMVVAPWSSRSHKGFQYLHEAIKNSKMNISITIKRSTRNNNDWRFFKGRCDVGLIAPSAFPLLSSLTRWRAETELNWIKSDICASRFWFQNRKKKNTNTFVFTRRRLVSQ